MKDLRAKDIPGVLIFIVLLPVILPLAAALALLYIMAGAIIYLAVWLAWIRRGKYVFLVYSNSPVWQGYVEEKLVPAVGDYAVMLNWSERKSWPLSLGACVFRYFGGYQCYNPMAVLFRPLRPAQIFRFYRPFQDFKHGRPEKVEQMTNALIEQTRQLARRTAS